MDLKTHLPENARQFPRHSLAADRLGAQRELILQIWESRARERLEGARQESHLALRDSLPSFLKDLEEALRTSVRNVRADLVRVAKKHGAERARLSDYTIEEALAEYNILRKVIFEVLEEESQLSTRESDVIYEAINFGITKAGTEFAKLQAEKLNRAKREAEHGRALLESVIAQMPAAVWISDVDGKLSGNRLSRTIMRQPESPAEKVDEYAGYIGYHPDGSRYRADEWPLSRALQKGETVTDELIRVEQEDGREAYVRLHAAPVRDSEGRTSAGVAIAIDVTEMMEAQARVADSESRLRLALAASGVGIFDVDLRSGEVRWTREEAHMFGFDPDYLSLLFDEVKERLHPEDRPELDRAIERAVARNGEYSAEFRVTLPSGETRWIRGIGQVMLGQDGQPKRIRGANLDITEIKVAQDARDRAFDRLFVITDAQPTLISYIDRDYTYQFVNRTYEDWFGGKKEEVGGKTMIEVLGEQAFAELRPYVDRALAGERVQFEREVHYQRAGLKSIQGTYVPDVGSDGIVHGVFVSVADVTEIKRSSELLRQQDERYRTVTELSPLIKFAADREGRNTYVNRAWLEYLGLDNTDGGRDAWIQAVHPEDRERTIRAWREAMSTKQIYENEYRLRRASDGVYHWFRVKARPVLNDDGEVAQWIGVAMDVDEQMRSNERHRELIASLQLEKSLREQFVNTLTHDLRTPLAAIKMAAQITTRRAVDPTIQSMASRILENVNRGDRMIQDLLDANRIKAGQGIVPEIQSIDLAEVVRTTLEDLTTIHGDRFDQRGPSSLAAWLCPHGIRRAIENLCNNAVKYGDKHAPIMVRIDAEDEWLRLSVHNQGPPLPEAEKERLFATFHRTQSAVDSGAKGWGIGLTIVKGVAEAHCGHVEVRSEADYGTEFTIVVPRDARGAPARGCGHQAV